MYIHGKSAKISRARNCLVQHTHKCIGVFLKTVLAAGRFLSRYFYWNTQRFSWLKGTLLNYAESIYVKTTKTASVSEEVC